MGCVRCGGSPAVPWEECHINEDTKTKLLAHADELKTLGVTLIEYKPLQKSADTTMTAIGLGIAVAESLHPGALRDIFLFLRDLAIPEEQILRLRLDEPEKVSEVLHDQAPSAKAKQRSRPAGRKRSKHSKR